MVSFLKVKKKKEAIISEPSVLLTVMRTSTSNYSLNTKETKSKADQFDDLFNEDKTDDLPF